MTRADGPQLAYAVIRSKTRSTLRVATKLPNHYHRMTADEQDAHLRGALYGINRATGFGGDRICVIATCGPHTIDHTE